MKNFLGLLLLLIFATGCNDGDLEIVTFDFQATDKLTSCNAGVPGKFYLYNFKDNRVFIVEIPESTFKNEVTADGLPIKLDVGTAIKVYYREYNSELTAAALCTTIPASNPTVTTEWTATGGKLIITTTAVKSEPNANTGATRITGYNHSVTFNNIEFNTGNGIQKNELINFGTYATIPVIPTDFTSVNIRINRCINDETLNFKVSGSQSMVLTVDKTIFNTAILGTPKVQSIDGVKNKLTYNVFSATVTTDYLCKTPIVIPTQTWTANTTGEIEVTTTTIGVGLFEHTIKFKNVTLTKGAESFKLGTEYIFGKYSTN